MTGANIIDNLANDRVRLMRRAVTERIFEGQLRTYRSDDDAGGYTWMAPLHTFDYHQRQGNQQARRKGFLDRLADLAIIVTDNRRAEGTFGDMKTYTPWERVALPLTATVLAPAVWALRRGNR